MAANIKPDRDQSPNPAQAQGDGRDSGNETTPEMQDWEIDHSTGKRKAHPGRGDHFVGNATETLQAPITNEPADQTRSHGNRPKGVQMGPSDHD